MLAAPASNRMSSWPTDIFAGAVASIITLAFGLSYSVLIFAGPLAPYLNYGIAATFTATAALATVVSLGSSFKFAVAAPESSTAAVAAILSTSVVNHLAATQPNLPPLIPVLVTLGGTAILTGLVLCGLGMTRLGRAIRYVPYPVVGGFLGATGYLVFNGGVRVISGKGVTQIGPLLHDSMKMAEIGAGFAMAAAMMFAFRRVKLPLAMPVILAIGIAGTHIVLQLAGFSLGTAQAHGWMFARQPNATLMVPWSWDAVSSYPWQALPLVIGDVIAVIFVTAISTLFNTTGIEVASRREVGERRELTVNGVANIASGLLGGFTGCLSLSRSLLTYNIGAKSRLAGLMVALTAAVVVIASPKLLSYVPKFVLGGLLIYLGLDQCRRWLIESKQRLSLPEYISLLTVALIIIFWGFVAGVLIGIVIGCATFALTAARIDAIKYRFDGTEYRSTLDRNSEDKKRLSAGGHEIQGLALQSYLFFGSANRLYEHVKELLERVPDTRFIIFDFHLVTGADSSAAYSFLQIKQITADCGVRPVFVGLTPGIEKSLRAADAITPDMMVLSELDRAFEHCENEVIARHQSLQEEETALSDWFASMLDSKPLAAELLTHCGRIDIARGDIIARAGENSDSMYFVWRGRIGVIAATGNGRTTRLRSLGPCTVVGELGLVSGQPRSATLQAEEPSVVCVLTLENYRKILSGKPELAQALLRYFMSVTAERLTFTNRTIVALQR